MMRRTTDFVRMFPGKRLPAPPGSNTPAVNWYLEKVADSLLDKAFPSTTAASPEHLSPAKSVAPSAVLASTPVLRKAARLARKGTLAEAVKLLPAAAPETPAHAAELLSLYRDFLVEKARKVDLTLLEKTEFASIPVVTSIPEYTSIPKQLDEALLSLPFISIDALLLAVNTHAQYSEQPASAIDVFERVRSNKALGHADLTRLANSIISASSSLPSAARVPLAKQVLISMSKEPLVVPDADTFNEVLKLCATNTEHNFQTIVETVREMGALGIQGNLTTLSTLITICDKLPMTKTRTLFFSEVLAAYTKTLTENIASQEVKKLVVQLAHQSCALGLISVSKQMLSLLGEKKSSKGEEMSDNEYWEILLLSASKFGLDPASLDTIFHKIPYTVKITRSTFDVLLSAAQLPLDKVDLIYFCMFRVYDNRSGLEEMFMETLASVVRQCKDNGEDPSLRQAAVTLTSFYLKQIMRKGPQKAALAIEPSTTAVNQLVWALGHAKQTVIASRLMDAAKRAEMVVDTAAVVNFLHACLKRKDSDSLVAGLKMLKNQKEPFPRFSPIFKARAQEILNPKEYSMFFGDFIFRPPAI